MTKGSFYQWSCQNWGFRQKKNGSINREVYLAGINSTNWSFKIKNQALRGQNMLFLSRQARPSLGCHPASSSQCYPRHSLLGKRIRTRRSKHRSPVTSSRQYKHAQDPQRNWRVNGRKRAVGRRKTREGFLPRIFVQNLHSKSQATVVMTELTVALFTFKTLHSIPPLERK